jgi:hypothetical protein
LPLVNLAYIVTQFAAHDVHPLADIRVKLLVLQDVLKLGRGNVPPVLDVLVRIEVHVKVLGTRDGRVETLKLVRVIWVESTNVLPLFGAPLLADKESVVVRPHVTILFDFGKLNVFGVLKKPDGFVRVAASRRQVLPDFVLSLLLNKRVHKIFDGHDLLPSLGVIPFDGDDLFATLFLVLAILFVVRFVQE